MERRNAVLSPCIMRGQSVRNVVANNPEAFGGVKERTVYDYIAGGLFDAKRGDRPEACSRRPRGKRKETKTNAKCRAGRDYRTFLEFCRVNGVTEWTELDTVIERVGGKVLFTMALPGGLMLLFLRDRKYSQTCTRIFKMLWRLAGPELFQKLFHVILTDNGAEFSDPDMIEKWRPDPDHNSAKLLPRGIHLLYCDAYCSSQKPRVERGHRENTFRTRTAGALYQIVGYGGKNEAFSAPKGGAAQVTAPESPRASPKSQADMRSEPCTTTHRLPSGCIYSCSGAFTFARYAPIFSKPQKTTVFTAASLRSRIIATSL